LTNDMDGDRPPAHTHNRPGGQDGDEEMFSPVMTWMDRALMQVVVVLAALPVLALVTEALVR